MVLTLTLDLDPIPTPASVLTLLEVLDPTLTLDSDPTLTPDSVDLVPTLRALIREVDLAWEVCWELVQQELWGEVC